MRARREGCASIVPAGFARRPRDVLQYLPRHGMTLAGTRRLHAEHHSQRHHDIDDVSAAGGFLEHDRDMAPRGFQLKRFRQSQQHLAHVAQRLERKCFFCFHRGFGAAVTAATNRDASPLGARLNRCGKGRKPTCAPAQPGCWSVAPLLPQAVQRAHRRSRSLDVSGPHRMMSGTNAIGAWWWHRSHHTQSQGCPSRSCASVGRGPGACRFVRYAGPRWVIHRAIARGLKLGGSPLMIRLTWRSERRKPSR